MRTWFSWDCWSAVPRQRWYCSGKPQEVKYPETSVHGQLIPQAAREHIFPHWSICVFTSTRAFRGFLQCFSSSVSNATSQPARKGRDQWSCRPAKSLNALPVVTFSSIPTLKHFCLSLFTEEEIQEHGIWVWPGPASYQVADWGIKPGSRLTLKGISNARNGGPFHTAVQPSNKRNVHILRYREVILPYTWVNLNFMLLQ